MNNDISNSLVYIVRSFHIFRSFEQYNDWVRWQQSTPTVYSIPFLCILFGDFIVLWSTILGRHSIIKHIYFFPSKSIVLPHFYHAISVQNYNNVVKSYIFVYIVVQFSLLLLKSTICKQNLKVVLSFPFHFFISSHFCVCIFSVYYPCFFSLYIAASPPTSAYFPQPDNFIEWKSTCDLWSQRADCQAGDIDTILHIYSHSIIIIFFIIEYNYYFCPNAIVPIPMANHKIPYCKILYIYFF